MECGEFNMHNPYCSLSEEPIQYGSIFVIFQHTTSSSLARRSISHDIIHRCVWLNLHTYKREKNDSPHILSRNIFVLLCVLYKDAVENERIDRERENEDLSRHTREQRKAEANNYYLFRET